MADLIVSHYYYDGEKPPQESCPGFGLKQDWMRKIKYATPICKISIPGTHDSMCYENPSLFHPQSRYIQCQNWTLQSQLDAGIRFIDIRYKVDENELCLYHSTYQLEGKTLNQNVMAVLESFLKENSSEFIICRLKDETSLERNKIKDAWDRFVINWKHLLFKSKSRLPVFNEEIKGKVVLLRDNIPETSASSSYSIKWTDDQHSLVDDFFIQFKYYDTILEGLTNNIENEANRDKLKLHFVSGTSVTHGPHVIAKEMNKRMCDYLKGEASKAVTGIGVMIMDYPGIGLIKDIIDTNEKIFTRVDVNKGLEHTDKVLQPLESYMQHLPDHMPIPLLSLAGKSNPENINDLLQNGFRVFKFNQHDDLTAVINEIGEFIDTHPSESVLIWPSDNASGLGQLHYIDYTQPKTLEDIRGETLLLAVNGNGLGDKVAAFEIPDGEKDINRIQEHFSQCATYENFHRSDNKTVITVTDDKNDLISYFTSDRKCHMTCGIVVIGNENEANDIININRRYPEMVQLMINSSDMLKDVDIETGLAVAGWNPYRTALNHKVIRPYMEFYINDYENFIEELQNRHVIDYNQQAKILKYLLEHNYNANRKLLVRKTIGCLQTSAENTGECVNRFIDVLKSHKELLPLAYFLLEWIAKCKMAKVQMNSGNSCMVNVKLPACDEEKVRLQLRKDPRPKLFGKLVGDFNVNTGSIEFQINVSSEEELIRIKEMIENKEFENNFSSWLREKGFDVKEDAKFEIQFSKIGDKSVLQVKEEMPSIGKTERIDEWQRELCVYIADSDIDEWRELGKNLGLSKKKLDDLSVEFSDNSDRCLVILVDWNENSTGSARDKITSLVKSLEKCGQKDVADKIKNELVGHEFSDMSLDATPGKDSFQNTVEFTVKTFLGMILNQHVKQTWGSELKFLLQDISAGALVKLSPEKEDLLKFQDYIYNNEKITLLAQEKQQLKQGNVDEFDIQLLYKLLKTSEISGIKTSHAMWLDIQKGNIADMLHPEKFARQNKKEQDLIHIQKLTSWVTLIVRYADEIAPAIQHVHNESQDETAAFIQALEYLTQYYESLKLTDSSTDFQQIEGNSDIEYRTQQEVGGEELSASNFLQPHAGSSEKNVEFPERFNPEFRFLKVQEQDHVLHQMHQLIHELRLILSEKKVEKQPTFSQSIMVHSVDLPKQVRRCMPTSDSFSERSESATRSVKSFRFTHVDLKSLGRGEKKITYDSEFPIKHDCFRICYVNHYVNHCIYIPYPHDDIELDTIKGPRVLQPLELSINRLVLAAGNGLFEVNCEGRVMCRIMKGKFRDVHVSGHLMAVIEHYTKNSGKNDRIHILSTTEPYPQSAVISLKFKEALTVLLSEDASTVYVSDRADHITTYSLSVKPISDEPISRWERVPTGELFGARLSAIDSSGHVLICDEFNNRLQLLSAGGEWMVLPGVHVSRPRDAFILDDILYVLDNCHKISMFKIE